MFLKRPEKILNKWQFLWYLGPSETSFTGYNFSFGIVKFTSFPELGALIERKHHKGFAVTLYFHWPTIYMRQKIFKFGKNKYRKIYFPTKLAFNPGNYLRIW